jgi:hypothetical protein
MLFINRVVMVGLLSVGITAATAAQAGTVKLFTAQWYTESFGNECEDTTLPYSGPGRVMYGVKPGGGIAPHCTRSTPNFSKYSVTGIPMGILCNADQPRCPISSTPTNGKNGKWSPLGGAGKKGTKSVNCASITTARPAKGATSTGGTMTFRVPPLYRNPLFFTSGGEPKITSCRATTTGIFPSTQTRFGANKGIVQRGNPVTGSWNASATVSGGFTIPPAPSVGPYGIRATSVVGQVANTYPYIYSYTYATIRNNKGVFGPGQGPGSFTYKYLPVEGKASGSTVASIMVAKGTNQFGGTMRMLGAMTTKVCYWLRAGGGGCSLGEHNWRYEAIGASAQHVNSAGVLTMGAIYTHYERYYNTAQGAYSAITLSGSRFPWTTGTVTITAIARGPHKTVHYAHGYDNRNTTTGLGKGTIQLVSPVLTRWFGSVDYETGGIGVLRIKFIPEPQTWVMLVAGVSLLGVATRLRGR